MLGADDARGQEGRCGLTIVLADAIMKATPHSEQGSWRLPRHSAAGSQRRLGPGRGCLLLRQLYRHDHRDGSIASILKNGLDRAYERQLMLQKNPAHPARPHLLHRLRPLKRCQGTQKTGERKEERKAMLKHRTEECLAALGLATGMAEGAGGSSGAEARHCRTQLRGSASRRLLIARPLECDNKLLLTRPRDASLIQNAVIEERRHEGAAWIRQIAVLQNLAAGRVGSKSCTRTCSHRLYLCRQKLDCLCGSATKRVVILAWPFDHRVPRLFDALVPARGDGRLDLVARGVWRASSWSILHDRVRITSDGSAAPRPAGATGRSARTRLDDDDGSQLLVEHGHGRLHRRPDRPPTPTPHRLAQNAHRPNLKGESLCQPAAKRQKFDALAATNELMIVSSEITLGRSTHRAAAPDQKSLPAPSIARLSLHSLESDELYILRRLA